MTTPKIDLPVRLDLGGPDGNAFMVMGAASRVIRSSGHPEARSVVEEYMGRAMESDYDNLLKVTCEYVRLIDMSGHYDLWEDC